MTTSDTPRCPKRGCGARAIAGHPCHDHDCPQKWVSADAYRQLETDLATAQRELEQARRAIVLTNELLSLFKSIEETDDGREFHPTTIQTCRCMVAARLDKLMPELRAAIDAAMEAHK